VVNVASLVATLFVGDEDEAEVLDKVTDGLDVEARLLDYSAGGSPTYRFEGSEADVATLRVRVGADES
jgi:hypothetical protein